MSCQIYPTRVFDTRVMCIFLENLSHVGMQCPCSYSSVATQDKVPYLAWGMQVFILKKTIRLYNIQTQTEAIVTRPDM